MSKPSAHPTPYDRKAAAAIYREAARKYETGEEDLGACLAISHITGESWENGPLTAPFHAYFKPRGNSGDAFWKFNQRGYDARILALCFMAAITERP